MRPHTLKQSVPPSVEPITRDELAEQLRLPASAMCEPGLLDELIAAAREQFELDTDTAVMRQSWRYSLPRLRSYIDLYFHPLQSVESVTYIDRQGVTRIVSPDLYRVLVDAYPGAIAVIRPLEWPSDVSVEEPYPWTINYTCGVDTRGEVHPMAKMAIRKHAADGFMQRSDSQPLAMHRSHHGYDAIVARYRVMFG